MLAAIDAVPFTEADRTESEAVLRSLTRGADVAPVSTRDLPTLPTAATGTLRTRRRTVGLVATAVVVVLGAAAVAFPWRSAPPAVAADTTRPLATAPNTVPPNSPPPLARVASGKLRILTTPPDAVILIDGQRAGVGSVIDRAVPVGRRRIQARAPGYASYDTTVDVAVGALVNLRRVTLRPVSDGP